MLVFDSGIGGLSIVAALRDRCPNVAVDYVADNAAYPYGELADETLIARAECVIRAAIEESPPDAVVIACNTASTVALGALRERLPLPIVGCVPPIKWAASLSETRVIGLLATRATVRRPYLRDLRQRFAADCIVLTHGARGLADIAERVFRGHKVDEVAILRELALLFDQPNGDAIDVVGIGCTHYSVLLDTFHRLSPRPMRWLDPAEAVARQAATLLQRLAPSVGAGPVYDRASFTAPPVEEDQVLRSLDRYGYTAIAVTPVVDAAEAQRRGE